MAVCTPAVPALDHSFGCAENGGLSLTRLVMCMTFDRTLFPEDFIVLSLL
jgi:hypothetical protein